MLQLIRRLGDFDIDVILSSHVLTDIEQTCSWVVMLDGGDLLRNGPLEAFDELGTVVVEVIDNVEEFAASLSSQGYGTSVDGRRLVVGPGGHEIEEAVVKAAAATSAGLVRMVRGSSSLEDLFLQKGEVS